MTIIKKSDPVLFGRNAKKTKMLGSLISVDKSHTIIKLLLKEPQMLITISKKLGFKLPLLIHYMRKLEDVKILTVTIKKHPNRNKDAKYYGVKPFILSMS